MIFIKFCVYLMGLTMFYMGFAETRDLTKQNVKHSFVGLLKNIIKVNEKRMDALKNLAELVDYDIIQTMTENTDGDDYEKYLENNNSQQKTILGLLEIMHAKGKLGRTRKSNNINNPAQEIQFLTGDVDRTDNVKSNLNNEYEVNNKINKELRKEDKELPYEKVSDRERVDLSSIESSETSKKHNEKLNVEVTDDDNKIAVTIEGKKIHVSIDDIRRSWMDSCSKKAARVCKNACINAHKNFCRTYSCSSRAKRKYKKECKISCKSKFVKSRYSDLE